MGTGQNTARRLFDYSRRNKKRRRCVSFDFAQEIARRFLRSCDSMKKTLNLDRLLRRSLVTIAIAGLAAGAMARLTGYNTLAEQCWFAATVPVIAGLAYSIVHDLISGRIGVDAIALLSMVGALALGQPLAGAVIVLKYRGGNVLEDFAVGRAERDLRSLVDRAPRIAHRRLDHRFEDVPVAKVTVGDTLLVRGGEVIPVDGVINSASATIDESALTGEPLPETKARGSAAFSGTLNAGEAFEMVASSVAGASTYAGIVRLVTAAQTAKAPFVRLADRFAVVLLPVTIAVAAAAWLSSGDLVRSLAVSVAATPCPLILAAPVAFIAGGHHDSLIDQPIGRAAAGSIPNIDIFGRSAKGALIYVNQLHRHYAFGDRDMAAEPWRSLSGHRCRRVHGRVVTRVTRKDTVASQAAAPPLRLPFLGSFAGAC
jgi:cation transport ATPase